MKNTVRITLSALFVAMSIIIGLFCKTFLSFSGGLLRISFESLPIIMSGIMFGPIIGGVVGGATDLITYFLSPQIYPPNLIVTLGCAMLGVCAGVISHYVVKKKGYLRLVLSCVVAHMIGSMVIKTVGLFQFYQWSTLVRIPIYAIIAAAESTVMCLLYKNASFRKLMEKYEL